MSFWLVAITLSILVFGGLTLVRHQCLIAADFLVAFGIRDAAWLWLGSVGGAAVTFGAFKGVRWLIAKLQQARAEQERRRREPLSQDEPLAILRKLRLAQLPFYLKTYTYGASEQRVFKLGFEAATEKAWVIPQILISKRGDASTGATGLLQKIENANNRPEDGLPKLIAAIEEALSAGAIEQPNWLSVDISRPEQVARDGLTGSGERASPIST